MFVALDLETHLIGPGVLAPRPVCASWATDEGVPSAYVEAFPAAWAQVENLLNSGHVICGANIAFDFGVIVAHRPALLPRVFELYAKGLVWDILIAAQMHAIADGRVKDSMTIGLDGQTLREGGDTGKATTRWSLNNCVWNYLGRSNAKENDEYRLRYGELDGVPLEQWPAVAVQYPKDDAYNTLQVAKKQQVFGVDSKILGRTWTHQTHQARAAFAMHLASMWGLRVDVGYLEGIQRDVEAAHAETVAKFKAAGFYDETGKELGGIIRRRVVEAYAASATLAPCKACGGTAKVASEKTGKPVNCKECGSTGLGLPPSAPRTPAGGVSVDRDTLRDSGDPLLEEFAKAGESDKLRETYLPNLIADGRKGPLNPRGNVLLASGRASYNGLIQLMPSKGGIREAFTARPGYVFCSVDYAALELCTLAQVTHSLFGASRMREVINETRDPGALHTELGAQLIGATDLDAFKRNAKVKGSREASARQMAKAANFGFPGLMGAATFVVAKRREGLRLCVASGVNQACTDKQFSWRGRELQTPVCHDCCAVAEDLKKQWLRAWPEIPEYFQHITRIEGVEDGAGIMESPLTGFRRAGLNASNAANHPFQHLAAVGAKHALWNATREAFDPKSPFYGSRPVVFIHDEIFAEVPEKRAHEAAWRLAEIMVNSMQEFVPDVHISAEPALMRRWSKQAEATYLQGKLVAWEG